MIRERAPAKLNLVLQVGRPRRDGLHEICSIFASLELSDEMTFLASDTDGDEVVCPGVDGPNLVEAALRLFRERVDPQLPTLRVTIDKRILGVSRGSITVEALRIRPSRRCADSSARGLRVRSAAPVVTIWIQVEPRHALVTGAGERVERLRLPAMGLVLVPSDRGLSTAEVYKEADRIESTRDELDPHRLRALAAGPVSTLAACVENDLQAAAISLRPDVGQPLEQLREAGALAAAVSGSGPTAFGVFSGPAMAERAAAAVPGAMVTRLAPG